MSIEQAYRALWHPVLGIPNRLGWQKMVSLQILFHEKIELNDSHKDSTGIDREERDESTWSNFIIPCIYDDGAWRSNAMPCILMQGQQMKLKEEM